MEMLDATLAFALTLAALATVITIILESMHRFLGMRRRNLAQIFKLLYDELGAAKLDIPPAERWDFVAATLRNPAVSIPSIPSSGEVAATGARPPRALSDYVFLFIVRIASLMPWDTRAKRLIRAHDAALAVDRPGDCQSKWKDRIGELTTVNLKAGAYDKVSLEHVLRRLAEVPSVRDRIESGAGALELEFDRVARKFEEFASAVSADFKRRSQTFSLLIGVVLALAANIDGMQIFETYRSNPALAQAVIEKEDDLRKTYDEVAQRSARLDALLAELRAAQTRMAAAANDEPRLAAAKQEVARLGQALEKEATPEETRKRLTEARGLLDGLERLGVPIGAQFYPHCLIERLNEKGCAPNESRRGAVHLILWAFSAIVTGMLIGLGAPFWFDVAKRLAEVRTMLGGSASAERRFGGKDANADPEKRRKIVEEVLTDAAGVSRIKGAGVG